MNLHKILENYASTTPTDALGLPEGHRTWTRGGNQSWGHLVFPSLGEWEASSHQYSKACQPILGWFFLETNNGRTQFTAAFDVVAPKFWGEHHCNDLTCTGHVSDPSRGCCWGERALSVLCLPTTEGWSYGPWKLPLSHYQPSSYETHTLSSAWNHGHFPKMCKTQSPISERLKSPGWLQHKSI